MMHKRKAYFYVLSVLFIIGVQLFIVSIVGLKSLCYHDECHFVETVKLIGQNPNIDSIKHYNEMSTPLPFVMYALWGRVVGFELYHLRILSIIVAVSVCFLFFRLCDLTFRSETLALSCTAFFVLNPYIIGLSVYVYTDMLTLLFMILGCLCILKQKELLLCLCLSGMLLCRQYSIFFVGAALLYYGIGYVAEKRTECLRMALAVICSIIPLVMLMLFWGGLSPDSEIRTVYSNESLFFHPSHVILYVMQLVIYLLPFVVFNWKHLYGKLTAVVCAFLLSWLYWVFPVKPSKYAIMINRYTTGLFHRAVRTFFQNELVEHIVFYVSFLLGLPVLFFFIRDCYVRISGRQYGIELFLDIAILFFIGTMSFAYMAWEKYFLPVFPLAILRLLLIEFPSKNPVTQPGGESSVTSSRA
jgi:hypothetical protein